VTRTWMVDTAAGVGEGEGAGVEERDGGMLAVVDGEGEGSALREAPKERLAVRVEDAVWVWEGTLVTVAHGTRGGPQDKIQGASRARKNTQ
jgi:hypothetical protein